MSYLSVSRDGYLIAEQTQQAYIKEAMSAYSRSLSEINNILKDTYATALDQVDPEKYLQVMRKANRYEKLKAKITESYKSASKESAKLIKNSLSNAMTENYNRQQYLSSLTIDGFKAKALNDNLLNYAITGNVDIWKKIQTEAIEKAWGNPLLYSPQAGTLTDLLTNNYTKELNAIMRSVQNGFITGKSYIDQAKGISKIIGDYLYKSGQESATGAMYNALRIARTEGQRVLNAGALASSYQAIANGADIKKRWIATLDNRTRESHIALDGQEVNVNDNFKSPITGATGQAPGQMSLAGDNINCFVGNNIVISDNIKAVTKREYSGKVVSIKTSSGINFTVTPNHPILTPDGWVPVKSLSYGDYLINVVTPKIFNMFDTNVDNNPTISAKFLNLFRIISPNERVMPTTNKDFHGDSSKGYVNIKFIPSLLKNGRISNIYKFVFNVFLTLPYILKSFLSRNGSLYELFVRPLHTSNGIVRSLGQLKSVFLTSVRHSYKHSFTSIPRGNTILSKNPINDTSGNIVNFSKFLNRESFVKGFDKIISVDVLDFTGHVYNLQNEYGMYIVSGVDGKSNGIIAHNCRCSIIEIVKGFEPETRSARNPVTGKSEIISYSNYDEWIKSNKL